MNRISSLRFLLRSSDLVADATRIVCSEGSTERVPAIRKSFSFGCVEVDCKIVKASSLGGCLTERSRSLWCRRSQK